MSREQQFDYLFKIVIIGDSGVGKTNLLSRFVDGTFSIDSKPTIGVEFATKTYNIDNKVIKNQIWDTAGQERFRAITNAYYRGAQGAIIVYDLTKSRTFDNLSKWLSQLRDNAEPDITIMLLGNKCDLENRDVKKQTVQDFINVNKLLYLETSALSGQNVDEAFKSLIKQIYEKVKSVPDQKRQEVTSTTTTPQQDAKNPNKQQPVNKPEVNKPVEPSKKPVAEQNIKLDDKKSKNAKKQKGGCC